MSFHSVEMEKVLDMASKRVAQGLLMNWKCFMRRCSTAIQTQWQEQFPAVHTSILWCCLRVDCHEEPFNLHLDETPQLMLFRNMSDVKICWQKTAEIKQPGQLKFSSAPFHKTSVPIDFTAKANCWSTTYLTTQIWDVFWEKQDIQQKNAVWNFYQNHLDHEESIHTKCSQTEWKSLKQCLKVSLASG